MKLQLSFETSGDVLEYDVIHNHELLEYFVEQCNTSGNNKFFEAESRSSLISTNLAKLHWAIVKSNEVLPHVIGKKFDQKEELCDYFDQEFLNALHSEWVFSHYNTVDIDAMRQSSNSSVASIGSRLHEIYPDEIRYPDVAPALEKLGYLFPFQSVNSSIHDLESSFKRIEMSSRDKWKVFDNPFFETMYSANDITNFQLQYTYVGRQNHDKFLNFDDKLHNQDFYNYEQLEYSFHLNLDRPQTIPFSQEFNTWAEERGVRKITDNLPIANLPNITERLQEYRTIMYNNFKDGNAASLYIK